MLDFSARIEYAAVSFLRDLRRQGSEAKMNSVHVDDYGQAHVRGGAFNASRERAIMSIAHGISPHDVAQFRKQLREGTGVSVSCEQADALLMEAQDAIARGTITIDMPKSAKEQRAYERKKKAKRRQWARENGLCIICCKEPAADRQDGTPGSTCKGCQTKANAAKR